MVSGRALGSALDISGNSGSAEAALHFSESVIQALGVALCRFTHLDEPQPTTFYFRQHRRVYAPNLVPVLEHLPVIVAVIPARDHGSLARPHGAEISAEARKKKPRRYGQGE